MEQLNIEKEGFRLKYRDPDSGNVCYTKKYHNHPRGFKNQYIDIINRPGNNHVLICEGDSETPYTDWDTIFRGIVLTQEDLKKVLSMVII